MADEERTACELNGDASVHERWAWVLANLPAIGKDSRNTQQDFKYRGIEAVLNELKPLFGKAGVFVIPARQKAEYGSYTTGRGTLMNTCKIQAMWQIWGVKGDHFTAETVGEASDTFDKGTSKAQTAAFKYLLWPGLAIAYDNVDNDGETPEEGVAQQPTGAERKFREMNPPKEPKSSDDITQPQINKIRIEANKLGIAEDGTDMEEHAVLAGITWPGSLSGLTKGDASKLIDRLVG